MSSPIKYRSRNGQHLFEFVFKDLGSCFQINCTKHPPLNGRDSAVEKTHLYRSKNICFVSGKEPRSLSRAKELAAQWAEYFLNYIKNGEVQS